MRPVELVVKYIAGEPLPDRRFEWAGVFICSEDDDIEEAFALSEPPTHDDWVYDNLPKGNTKTFVRVALARLNEIARPGSGQAIQAEAQSVDGPSLAATASTMGAFLDKVSATGPGKSTPGPGSPSARKTLAISRPRFVGLQLWDDGHPVARFQADLQNDGSDEQLHVIAEPHLIIDGGLTATGDLPGWFALSVSDISLGDVRKSPFGPWIHVGYLGGAVEFLVPTVPGAAVGLKLRLKSGSPE